MRRLSRLVLLPLLMLTAASCTPMARIGPAGSPPGTVTHVVIMWMYDPGDETAQNEILVAGTKLQTLPGVLSITAGTMIRSLDRPVVDSTYDMAFVMTFKDEDAMRKYLENPVHVDLKKTVLDRYVERYKVYDFVAK